MLTETRVVTSAAYALLPAGKFYAGRRKKIKAAVVHVTAGLQDLGLDAPDTSAERTNTWALNSGVDASWHRIADTDGVITCLPSWYTAWQAKDYNSTTVGNEVANVDARWDNKPADWIKWTIWFYAMSYADYVITYQIPMRRATKAELDAAIANDTEPVGFIDHSRLSTNRSDPGSTFPWAMFFRFMEAIIAGATHPDNLTAPEEDMPLSDADADKVLTRDIIPATMFPNNPTVTPVTALKFAMEWSLSGRNAAQAAARDSAAALEIVKAMAAKPAGETLSTAEIEAAAQRGATSAVQAIITDAEVNLTVEGSTS